MHLTSKQYAIMTVVCAGDGKDEKGNLIPADMDQLLEKLSYKTSKHSMHFSIRALIRAGILFKGPRETRRGRGRVTFFPTELGRQLTRLGSSPSFLEPNPNDKILNALTGETPRSAGSI